LTSIAPHPAPAAPAGVASQQRPTVIYVMGAGRSGSTVLGVALGNCQGVFYAGELDAWLRRSGVPNFGGAAGASFWAAVRECVAGEEMFGEEAWRQLEYSLSCFRVHRRRTRQRLRKRYRPLLRALYGAITRGAGVTHVVDTAHYPLRARELQRLSDVELYIIYLVRRPQDVVASFKRRNITNIPKTTLSANVYLYLTHMLSVWVFLRQSSARRLLLRYEDFVATPHQTLQDILAWTQLDTSAPADLSSLSTGTPFQGNRLLGAARIDLHHRPTFAPSHSLGAFATSVLQYPWRLVLSRLH
jgi:hypothetical protein